MQFIRLPKAIDIGERVLPKLVVLGGHLEYAELQYYCPPAAPSKYVGLLSYRVVEKLNAPSAHL